MKQTHTHMKNILTTLKETDPIVLPLIARKWQVNPALSDTDLLVALSEAMHDAQQMAQVWGTLNDLQRGQLQLLLSSAGQKMPTPKFSMLAGELRKVSPRLIEKERPHEMPISAAEALFYCGLIAETMDKGDAGIRPVVYIPTDLVPLLNQQKNSYSDLKHAPLDLPDGVADDDGFDEAAATDDAPMKLQAAPEPTKPLIADTTLVDDVTTLLGYVQVFGAGIKEEDGLWKLNKSDQKSLKPHLLSADERRFDFVLGVALAANLLERHDKKLLPNRNEMRRWLNAKRSEQLFMLCEAWRTTEQYRDLWHVAGLHPENVTSGGMGLYNPAAARNAALALMSELTPRQSVWWSIGEWIEQIKEQDADFQRNDYESWYIRNRDDEYLRGFESWDSVEGALLEYYLYGPLHWLGLADVSKEHDVARMTAYGRAFVSKSSWPQPVEKAERPVIQPDGTLQISRRVPRMDRFQAMRFAQWEGATPAHYTYTINAAGLKHAEKQGIEPTQIANYIQRALGENIPIPTQIQRLLDNIKPPAPAPAVQTISLERVLILRTTAPEVLTYIMDTPALRRFMGAVLGNMAAIVRADDLDAFAAALTEHHIQAEVIGVL
jgi:hypothetical protein